MGERPSSLAVGCAGFSSTPAPVEKDWMRLDDDGARLPGKHSCGYRHLAASRQRPKFDRLGPRVPVRRRRHRYRPMTGSRDCATIGLRRSLSAPPGQGLTLSSSRSSPLIGPSDPFHSVHTGGAPSRRCSRPKDWGGYEPTQWVPARSSAGPGRSCLFALGRLRPPIKTGSDGQRPARTDQPAVPRGYI